MGFQLNNSTIRELQQNLKKTVYKIGEDLLEESNMEVPVDTGNLRDSGRVTEEPAANGKAHVNVEYDADYAIYVHENLQARHPNGGKAKFLEDALDDKHKEYIKWIGEIFK